MSEVIHIYFSGNYFKKGDVLTSLNANLKVISDPKKTWYKVLFELISFGFYKAPTYYKCKVVEYE